MPQLPNTYEKDYLELLKPYISDEQKKSRRNVLVSSFTVICIYMLDKSITDLNVFGLSLKGSNSYVILLLATLLITYWLVMYLSYLQRDSEIHKEQKFILLKHVEDIRERKDKLVGYMEDASVRSHYQGELNDTISNLDVYERQLTRTGKAESLNAVLNRIECWLPLIAGGGAIVFICIDAYKVLNN